MRSHHVLLGVALLLAASLASLTMAPNPAYAARSYDNCNNFITSLPATIGTQGTWCLDKDLATTITSGAAITINVNNVTIDCNDFKIGDLAAGPGTQAVGIEASNKLNATIRNCTIRGFYYGTNLTGTGGGHVIEDNRFDQNTVVGINVEGDVSIVRRNLVRDTGGSSALAGIAYGIRVANDVDVQDNTVSIVAPTADANGNATALGIVGDSVTSGTVDRNTVRSPLAMGAGTAIGVDYSLSPNANIYMRDNFLAGPNGSTGFVCADKQTNVNQNIVNGYAAASSKCNGNFFP